MTLLNGAMPAFAVSGGMPLAAVRGAFDLGLFSAFGTLLFWVAVLPRARDRMPAEAASTLDRRLLALAQGSLLAALLAGAAWLAMEAEQMSGADTLPQWRAALPVVAGSTAFGHLLLVQGAGLVAALLLLGSGGRPVRRPALAASAVVLLLQAGHGHGMSMSGALGLLTIVNGVHLLAGGAWLGGLLPLLLAARIAPPRAGATAARSFSVPGKWYVGLVAATAGYQAFILVGSVPGLVGTAYGWMVCAKLMLFGVLLGFAWVNRYRFAPALLGSRPDRAKGRLVASIAVQSGFGVLVLLAAGVLASLAPSLHVQAIWPFSERLSLATVREDAGFRLEGALALGALAIAAALALSALMLRRWRRAAALAVAVAITVLAAPHLDLLLVEASPTSFYRSPTGFGSTSIMEGASLYPGHCAACHGADGRGDGPMAAGLPVPPADLSAGHLWMHDDGELFWWLTHGIEAPEGGQAMPGFASVLSEDQRWALIDFIRARNAGLAKRATGAWPVPVRAPGLQATCAGSHTVTLAELRGRIVRVVFGAAPAVPDPDVVTVRVSTDPGVRPDARTCVANDPAVAPAYALVTGDASGQQVLIDAQGWLERVAGPGSLEADIRAVRDRRAGPPVAMRNEHMAL